MNCNDAWSSLYGICLPFMKQKTLPTVVDTTMPPNKSKPTGFVAHGDSISKTGQLQTDVEW